MAPIAVLLGCSPDLTAAFSTTSTLLIHQILGLAFQSAARVMSTVMGSLTSLWETEV